MSGNRLRNCPGYFAVGRDSNRNAVLRQHCRSQTTTGRRAMLVIQVKINRFGPFDFMVDTGSRLNVIAPLAASGACRGIGFVGGRLTGSAAASRRRPVSWVDSGGRSADLGVLGENFPAHLDVLIDFWALPT